VKLRGERFILCRSSGELSSNGVKLRPSARDSTYPWRMDWTTPSFEEIKMDAEIGSYQPDDERRPDRAVELHAA
jgi:hypothetical protein